MKRNMKDAGDGNENRWPVLGADIGSLYAIPMKICVISIQKERSHAGQLGARLTVNDAHSAINFVLFHQLRPRTRNLITSLAEPC